MVGGRLRCLSCFFTYSVVLLLGVYLHDMEASSCRHIIHKEVGDTVEFSSCLPTEGVTTAIWKYGALIVADKVEGAPDNPPFKGRADLNPTNFSLTLRELTLQDSGDFFFISEANDQQRETVTITLKVHEPITEPVLNFTSTWHPSDKSCSVLLECTATSDSNVTYKWTVRNQTQSGSRLQYNIRPEDGETTFTCTISNFVSERSEFKTVTCSNNTVDLPPTEPANHILVLILATAGGCLIVLIVVCIICVCRHKQKQPGSDSNDLTVYADISEVVSDDAHTNIQRTSTTTKSCSLYETIDNCVNTVTPGPETVYDKIQLDRMRKATMSNFHNH